MSKNKKIIWRWIPGYKGRYRVSTHGKVKSYVKSPEGKLLKQQPHYKSEYMRVRLKHEDGTRYTHLVHRLVLMAFKGLPEIGLETRHLDGSRTNNRVDNLEWGTIDENIEDKRRHGTLACGERIHTAKLTDDIVRHLRRTVVKYGASITYEELAAKFDVAPSTIANAINRISWKHVGGPDCSARLKAVGAPPAALDLETAQVIRDAYIAGTTSTQLAKDYGVSQATVSFVLNKKGHYKNLEGPDIDHTHRMGPGKVTDEMIEDIRHGYAVNQHYTVKMYEDKYNLCTGTVHNIVNAKGPYAYLGKKIKKKKGKLDPQQVKLIKSMVAQGVTQKVIAAEFGVTQSAVSRALKR